MPIDVHVFAAIASDEMWRHILSGIRTSLPHASIVRVKDGEQAVRFLFQTGLLTSEPPVPDVIFVGSDLPRVASYQLVERIRTEHPTQLTPVIVVTATSQPELTQLLDVSHIVMADGAAVEQQVAGLLSQLGLVE